jgi:hypothetical protein
LVTVALNLRKSDCKPTRSSRGASACLRGYAIGVSREITNFRIKLFTQSYTRLSGLAQAQSFRAVLLPARFPLQFAGKVLSLVTRSFRMKACGQSSLLVSR